jgi:hypothetical protein
MANEANQIGLGGAFATEGSPKPRRRRSDLRSDPNGHVRPERLSRLRRLAERYPSEVGPAHILDIAVEFFLGGICDRAEALGLCGFSARTFSRTVVNRKNFYAQHRKRGKVRNPSG